VSPRPNRALRLFLVACLILAASTAARGQSTSRQLGETGWRAVQAGDGDRAADAFRQALALQPRDPVLQFGAGVAAHLQGREHDAIVMLQKAVQGEPRLTQAAALLGEIAYHEGDLDLAIKAYEQAIEHAPGELAMRQRLEAWRSESSTHSAYQALKDDRFAIMFDGPVQEKLAARATSVLGSAFWRIGKTLGAYPSAPITVILYSERQFRDITGAPEWAGGGFDGQIRMPVRGASQNLSEFDRVLTHELTHAMLKSVAPRNLPAWLNEGLAMHFEGRDAAKSERNLAAARVFVPLAALQTSFGRLNAVQATVAYEESAFAARALLDRIGPSGLAMLMQDLDTGQPLTDAIGRFGFTLADFEGKLARRVGVTLPAAATRP